MKLFPVRQTFCFTSGKKFFLQQLFLDLSTAPQMPNKCSPTAQQLPNKLTAYQQRVFDQGLGRSLWFSKGAQVDLIISQIATFSTSRQSDLWSGLGLAAAYAGGVNEAELLRLKKSAGDYFPHFSQGVTFAAKTRLRAGNKAEQTEAACLLICELSLEQAAKLTDDALVGLNEKDELPAYEQWRQRIQQNFIN